MSLACLLPRWFTPFAMTPKLGGLPVVLIAGARQPSAVSAFADGLIDRVALGFAPDVGNGDRP